MTFITTGSNNQSKSTTNYRSAVKRLIKPLIVAFSTITVGACAAIAGCYTVTSNGSPHTLKCEQVGESTHTILGTGTKGKTGIAGFHQV